jgi:uncharacterized membrane protein
MNQNPTLMETSPEPTAEAAPIAPPTIRSNSPLVEWYAPEHSALDLGPKAKLVGSLILAAIVAYALYTDSALMAIVFIMAGVVTYLLSIRAPRNLRFAITGRGVVAHDEFYPYENIESFWIHTEPPLENLLSLKNTTGIVRHVHIPVITIPHEKVRDRLREFIPEEEHDAELVDILERMLHI